MAASDEVDASPTKIVLAGQSWVLWRGSDGAVYALGDKCPHLHGTTFPDPDPVVIPVVHIDPITAGFRWEFTDKFRIPGTTDFDPVVTDIIYEAPYWVTATTVHPVSGAAETIVTVAQPEGLDGSRLYVIMLHNGLGFPDDDVDARVKFWDQVMYEDVWLLETMQRKDLELSLATKASSAADRTSVELHRQLAALAKS